MISKEPVITNGREPPPVTFWFAGFEALTAVLMKKFYIL
jgi:hypothetical protein